jgi:hypothetical protein
MARMTFQAIGPYQLVGVVPATSTERGMVRFRLQFIRVRRRDRALGRLIALYALATALRGAAS